MTAVPTALKTGALCVLVLILILILALVIVVMWQYRHKLLPGIADGGNEDTGQDEEKVVVDIDEGGKGQPHGVGAALHKHALGMTEKDVVGVHNLSGQGYTSVEQPEIANVSGGKARAKKSHAPKTGHWTEFETWSALMANKKAMDQYMKDRARVLNNLKLDWSHVISAVSPLLDEDKEYIGLIDAESDGVTLKVTQMEASPVKAGEDWNPNVYASIPSEIVDKISSRPALMIFHSHPKDTKASPLPSAADVSTAITMGYAGTYAANVIISRYGVILYTLSWATYQRIHRSPDPMLAMLHLRYDMTSYLMGIRSWRPWSLADYKRAYDQYGILFVVYPSSDYTAAEHLLMFHSNPTSPSDFEFLDVLRDSIEQYEKKHRRRGS